ncbi:hypothetical protein GA0115240_16151 [Streptomyces sp. DvalAA-14]|uniref:DUF2264 domain-containing protein n=1 Tax=unclassified Streptomyces TaxID=2593676 RepID=UPI00081B8012|nr:MULTISPECIES: DUF2264 domain-containing protein [unclassified Streptomyces]MYS24225.1 DUF2264 domain-containing protein [Streptomyces sp. SID4948]SCE43932.1 hypothetical protein GA0115240_16151 [Streptomyces sp. DvalAA-14]
MASGTDGPVTRADLQAYARELADPLPRYASLGGARIRLGVNIAHHDDTAAELEGYARPLWGLAPLAAGGGRFAHWDVWARGLAAGTDPEHPEYWGAPDGIDQRTVETAALGFALALVPERLWEPLSGKERDRAGAWLAAFLTARTPANNWNFFPVMVSLGLDRVGYAHDRDARHARLDRLESYALGGGWYGDGATEQRDYYIPWAMHFYGLIYAALAGDGDPARAERFRQRAAEFAVGFRHWFADDGSAVPFGRSLTYRFAQGAFWGALPYAGVDAVPYGEVKGLLLRHLRWWRARTGQTSPDGLLSVGYGYPQPGVAEQYNGPASPYWALKAFLPLALPAAHPFWTAEETALPADLPAALAQPEAGAVLMRSGGDVTMLSGRQHNTWVRGGAAKYGKFAYSTRFGFSLPAGELGLAQGAYDSMLAVSDDAGEPAHHRVREQSADPEVLAADGTVRSVWRPWPDVEITTWLTAAPPWHLRTHRVRTARPLSTAEGAFAVDRDAGLPRRQAEPGAALAVSAAGDLSGIRDLASTVPRAGQVIDLLPGTNVLARRTALPTLTADLPPGTHWLRCAVLATGPSDAATWEREPPERRF